MLPSYLSCLRALLSFTFTPDLAVIYPLSLHDALPIFGHELECARGLGHRLLAVLGREPPAGGGDRKSTRLNSSHVSISYAVFCLKKKNQQTDEYHRNQHSAYHG